MTQLLRNNIPFVLLLATRVVSEIGNQLLLFVVPWVIYNKTHSALALGITVAVGYLGEILGPFAGMLADGTFKKAVLVATDVLALVITSIGIAHGVSRMTPLYLYCFSFILGMVEIFYWPVMQSSIRMIVPPGQIAVANGTWTSIKNAIWVGAPLFAGFGISKLGIRGVFVIAAFTYMCAIILDLSLRLPAPSVNTQIADAPQVDRIGIRFIMGNRAIRLVMVLTLMLNIPLGALEPQVLYIMRHRLHLAAVNVGTLLTVSNTAGILSGIAFPQLVQRASRNSRLSITSGLLLLIPAGWMFAFNMLTAQLSAWYMSFATSLFNVNVTNLRQEIVPVSAIGRVSAVFRAGARILGPVTPIIGGLLVSKFGVSTVLDGCFAFMILTVATVIGSLRQSHLGEVWDSDRYCDNHELRG
ncbi:Macrolide-efflux protein [Sulfobacillus acidophilus TPY]|uniref:Major facilitator superfamily MFS_1 n=1 Tax=Sulfobacillus acidophilus (strain ATCC 700253 / DSM 10332 / NAL) TaxID=679936 RepID=G8TZY4_SULAD|nr:Macrolide-efflux protein [Sulfobacillus acidophilus TPY]AEW04153.1 major facilitator superfamily MFS_1 [Sulfobacillus acidophilus DSM 10332]